MTTSTPTTSSIPPRARRTPRRALARTLAVVPVALAALGGLTAPATATGTGAGSGGDDALEQTLGDLEVVHGTRVLDAGHVDMGPVYVDGEWRFLVHDDLARDDPDRASVWRYPDETVFRVGDQARLTQPDDPAYAFTGAAPGDPIWVAPQTQDPEVVWIGWNTQDPQVMETIDRGVTLTLTGVEGPGTATVYLQSGSFGEPDVLWDSRVADPQPLWVDVNTHTHANWVFTEPGTYLVRLTASADLVDGSEVSDTQYVRFAVGTDTAPEDALAATWQGPADPLAGDAAAPAAAGAAAAADDGGALEQVLVVAVVVVALALVVGFAVALTRSARARRRVLAARAAGATPAGEAAGS